MHRFDILLGYHIGSSNYLVVLHSSVVALPRFQSCGTSFCLLISCLVVFTLTSAVAVFPTLAYACSLPVTSATGIRVGELVWSPSLIPLSMVTDVRIRIIVSRLSARIQSHVFSSSIIFPLSIYDVPIVNPTSI